MKADFNGNAFYYYRAQRDTTYESLDKFGHYKQKRPTPDPAPKAVQQAWDTNYAGPSDRVPELSFHPAVTFTQYECSRPLECEPPKQWYHEVVMEPTNKAAAQEEAWYHAASLQPTEEDRAQDLLEMQSNPLYARFFTPQVEEELVQEPADDMEWEAEAVVLATRPANPPRFGTKAGATWSKPGKFQPTLDAIVEVLATPPMVEPLWGSPAGSTWSKPGKFQPTLDAHLELEELEEEEFFPLLEDHNIFPLLEDDDKDDDDVVPVVEPVPAIEPVVLPILVVLPRRRSLPRACKAKVKASPPATRSHSRRRCAAKPKGFYRVWGPTNQHTNQQQNTKQHKQQKIQKTTQTTKKYKTT